jgi:RNA polymerase sigma factor (sigma-70 family)
MATSQLSGVIQHLRSVLRNGAGLTDEQLLEDYLSRRDESAFAALVRRHGPMVWGVCRRVLCNHHDAEDAFQATFLVFVRRAASIASRELLVNWLYGVAHQTALKARATAAKRKGRERQVMEMPEPAVTQPDPWRDLQPVLDEELSRLPDKYRGVLVLCDLEGKTRKEVAGQLGCPEGTVASRLARARIMLAKRLTGRGVVFSGGSVVAALSVGSASASAPPALVASTIKAASLLAAGQTAGVVSAKVAALTEGMVRAMFLAKLKAVTCALALTVLVGLGGVALVPGSGHMPAAGAATAPQEVGAAKPVPEAQKLVRQLGSPSFAKRQMAEKALANMGARAAASVRAGMGDADPEVAKRCSAIWPRLWQTEIARPDAERLAGFAHPLWVRFRKVAGDDARSRTLFAEMVSDVNRFRRLEAVEADPKKAAAAYAADLKQRAEALERGYREAAKAAENRTGDFGPASGIPTRAEFVTLLFLGTYPATARDESARDTHNNVFALGLATGKSPAFRRLYAAWLRTRTDPQPIEIGLSQALYHNLPEVVPLAAAHAANARLAPKARGFALLVVGLYGTPADLPLLKKAFADARVFHTTKYTSEAGKERPIEVQVGDTAVGSALWIYGQRAADFGFPFAAKYKNHPETLAKYYLLGFCDNDTRQAVHKKAAAWLDKHKDDKVKRMEITDWQPLFDGKTTKHWKTEGQVSVENGLLKIGGDKGGSLVTSARCARGFARFSYRQAGEAKATMTWRGEEHSFTPARQGWTSEEYEPAAAGQSPIRIVAPPGTTLLIRDFAFRPY